MGEYKERDHNELGEHYIKHVSAMTGEGLHSKAAIAAELAYRDTEIERLRAENDRLSNRFTFTNEQVASVVRAFWRRIQPYVYAENEAPYSRELGAEIPVEFQAHMGTALFALHLHRKPDSEVE